jgi:RimJ/RimL family protein N-acetyltransferase
MESAAACARYAFDRLQRARVVALIRPENTPSRQLALKLGMQPGKTILHANLDHIVYSLHRTPSG